MKILAMDQGLFEKEKGKMEWISFVGEMNGFIFGLEVSESEARKWLWRKMNSGSRFYLKTLKGKWNEKFID